MLIKITVKPKRLAAWKENGSGEGMERPCSASEWARSQIAEGEAESKFFWQADNRAENIQLNTEAAASQIYYVLIEKRETPADECPLRRTACLDEDAGRLQTNSLKWNEDKHKNWAVTRQYFRGWLNKKQRKPRNPQICWVKGQQQWIQLSYGDGRATNPNRPVKLQSDWNMSWGVKKASWMRRGCSDERLQNALMESDLTTICFHTRNSDTIPQNEAFSAECIVWYSHVTSKKHNPNNWIRSFNNAELCSFT